MDSASIAKFLESTYPDPPVQLTSDLGDEVETRARAVVGKAFRMSVLPRELAILSPRAQDYFRRSCEASLGHSLEDSIDPEKEEENWRALDDGMRAVGALMLTHKAEGPFILGERPSYADFSLAGAIHSARVVDEGVFQRIIKFPGFVDIYDACLPYMEKRD